MSFIKYVVLVLLTTALASCDSASTKSYPYGPGYDAASVKNVEALTKAKVEDRIGKAKSALKQVPDGFAWRFTKKHIKGAEKLLKKSKLKKAYARASRALFEAETALQQSEVSNKEWESFVISSK